MRTCWGIKWGHRKTRTNLFKSVRQTRTTTRNFFRVSQFDPCTNTVLYLVSKLGLGLVRAGVLISATSQFLLGILLFLWLTRYLAYYPAFCVGLVTMITRRGSALVAVVAIAKAG